jgi:hypothetical protein
MFNTDGGKPKQDAQLTIRMPGYGAENSEYETVSCDRVE